MSILTRYILREWFRVLGITVLGFPILVIAIDLTDNLSIFLARGLSREAVALSYLYFMPENMFLVLPAAVLFATVFTIGNLGRHSELIAAHASGLSFLRLVTPILIAGFFAMFGGVALAEMMPNAARRRAELLGERETRSRTTRYNFVYRADEGWVYSIRALEAATNEMRDPVLERHGAKARVVVRQPRLVDPLVDPKPFLQSSIARDEILAQISEELLCGHRLKGKGVEIVAEEGVPAIPPHGFLDQP